MNQGGNNMPKLKRTICNFLLCVLLVTQVMSGIPTVQAASTPTELKSIILSGGNFDTGIKINQAYSLQMTFSLSTLTQYKNLFYSDAYTLRNEASRGLYIKHGWYNEKVFAPAVNKDVTILQKKNTTYINGYKILTATLQNITSKETLKFGDFKGAIKEFKIWNSGGTLVADYIPALDGNKKPCMYDKVTGKYKYYSGSCTAGKNVDKTETSSGTNTGSSTGTTTGSDTNIKVEASDSVELGQNTSSSSGTVKYVDGLKLNGGTFDTNIKLNQDYSVEIAFTLSALNQYRNLYTSNVHTLRNEAANGLYAKHGWYNDKVYVPKVNEEIVVLQKKNVTYVNDVKKQNATYQTIKGTSALTFGNFLGTIASFRVWNDKGTLIAEYLPALDKNNKACMYDAVNKKYVYYSGTCTAIEEATKEDASSGNIIFGEIVSKPVYGSSSNATAPSVRNEETFKKELLTLLTTGDTKAHDFSKYGYHWEKVSQLYNEVVENEGRIAYASCANMYYSTTKDSAGRVLRLKIENIDSGYLKRYQSLKKIVENLVNKSKGMTELEKTILAHDYVVTHCSYHTGELLYYTAGSALVDGKALCTGYARAMVLLLQEMGVESGLVSSSKMTHSWVKVKVNGKWYHADPTWADTRTSIAGKVSHTFLLRTDAEYLAGGNNRHYGWEGTVSTDTSYTNWKVHDIVGELCYENGTWYYMNTSGKKVTVNINK